MEIKQQLFINQIIFFINEYQYKLDILIKEKENYYIKDFNNAIKNIIGKLHSLNELDINKPIEIQIINLIEYYNNKLKLGEYRNFYFVNGVLTILMILLTISDNPQSSCPLNKDILLKKYISDLEIKYQEAILNKDNKKVSEFKLELKIMNNYLQENFKLLKI